MLGLTGDLSRRAAKGRAPPSSVRGAGAVRCCAGLVERTFRGRHVGLLHPTVKK